MIIGKDAWEMEDYLQSFKSENTDRPVFCSMFNENKSAHSDSYGTCLNYPEFYKAFDASIKSGKYTKEQWLDSSLYWLTNENCGVPLKLIARYVQRYFNNPN